MMRGVRYFPIAAVVILGATSPAHPRAEQSGPQHANQDPKGGTKMEVRQQGEEWVITGRDCTAWWNPADGSVRVEVPAGPGWESKSNAGKELKVRAQGRDAELSLADASRKESEVCKTGYAEGVRTRYSGFKSGAGPLDLEIALQVSIEKTTGELLFEVIPLRDPAGALEECRWPQPFAFAKAGMKNYTVLPCMQGCLIPSDWAQEWKGWYGERTCTRALYMPWWGQVRADEGYQVILETPWDGGIRVTHPAGGPTRVRPVWFSSLGSLRYSRRVRYVFYQKCNYVTMAKRYRRYAIETGLFRSLAEKEAANPKVGQLRGAAVVHTSILYHMQPESPYYNKTNPAANHQLTSFATRQSQLAKLRERLPETNIYVHLDGWGLRGYDNLHPDILPPCPEAGGWEGLRELAESSAKQGILFALHDQYRDYYFDAASFDLALAVKGPGGEAPTGNWWLGGKQSILCATQAPSYVKRNYDMLAEHKIFPGGVYLDVFAIADLDECYDPFHPMAREQCAHYRALGFREIRSRGMVVSSEEPVDFAVPDIALVHHAPYALVPNPEKGPAIGIAVPLFSLVYHDALVVPWSAEAPKGTWGIPDGDWGFLHALLNAGAGYMNIEPGDEELARNRALSQLHQRVGGLEMTDHQFLDDGLRRQRTTFADGTTVEVDFSARTYAIRYAGKTVHGPPEKAK
jgi:hypothetical protein